MDSTVWVRVSKSQWIETRNARRTTRELEHKTSVEWHVEIILSIFRAYHLSECDAFRVIESVSEITYIQIRRRISVPLTHRLSYFYPWTKRLHQQTPSPVHWPSNSSSFCSVHRRWQGPLEWSQWKYDSTPDPFCFCFLLSVNGLRQSITIYSLGVCVCLGACDLLYLPDDLRVQVHWHLLGYIYRRRINALASE